MDSQEYERIQRELEELERQHRNYRILRKVRCIKGLFVYCPFLLVRCNEEKWLLLRIHLSIPQA